MIKTNNFSLFICTVAIVIKGCTINKFPVAMLETPSYFNNIPHSNRFVLTYKDEYSDFIYYIISISQKMKM